MVSMGSYRDNPTKGLMLNAKSQRKYSLNLKQKIVAYYSNGTMACANLFGEHEKLYTNIETLSIDHINGGGNEERKRLGNGGTRFYQWLVKNNYPKGYQILCMNCQFIKKKREVKTKYNMVRD